MEDHTFYVWHLDLAALITFMVVRYAVLRHRSGQQRLYWSLGLVVALGLLMGVFRGKYGYISDADPVMEGITVLVASALTMRDVWQVNRQ